MAGFINYHFRSKLGNRLPIAFIGSFHTPGIIAKLDSDVGYVVIEPQRNAGATKQEMERFNNALHGFKNHIQTLTNRKLHTKTDAEDIERYLAAEDKKISTLSLPPELTKVFGGAAGQIMNSIQSNNVLAGAEVLLADVSGAIVPSNVPRLPGLIASFHPSGGGGNINNGGGGGGSITNGEGGGNINNGGGGGNLINNGGRISGLPSNENKPMFVLYPEKKGESGWQGQTEQQNWSNPDRLNFLKYLVFIPPAEMLAKNTKKASIEQFGDKIYMVYHEPDTGDYYIFEGDKGINATAAKANLSLGTEGMNNLFIHLNIS